MSSYPKFIVNSCIIDNISFTTWLYFLVSLTLSLQNLLIRAIFFCIASVYHTNSIFPRFNVTFKFFSFSYINTMLPNVNTQHLTNFSVALAGLTLQDLKVTV